MRIKVQRYKKISKFNKILHKIMLQLKYKINKTNKLKLKSKKMSQIQN